MSKFRVREEVIFSKGDLKDVRGVVHNPYWQASQSDWPEVVVDYSDGEETRRILVNIDDVRPAEDPYEYKVQHQDLDSRFGGWSDAGLGMWVDEETAVKRFTLYSDEDRRWAEKSGVRMNIYRIVRRPKGSETVYRTEDEDV